MRFSPSYVERLRARTLAVLGFAGPLLALPACHENGPAPQTPDTSPIAVAPDASLPSSSDAAGSVTDASSPAVSDAAPDAGPLVAVVGVPPLYPPRPTCPTGEFCEPSKKKPSKKDAAPAPFEACWAHSPNPGERPGPTHAGGRVVTFSEPLTKAAREKQADVCCYTWWVPCPGGRAFRDEAGNMKTAVATSRSDWRDASFADAAVRDAALAASWAEDAAFEHASIAAFARLTMDLLALGAPADLVLAAQSAAADEVRHAQVAYALASAYGGAPVGPGPLASPPARTASLAVLATESLEDGCIGEALAASTLRARAEAAREAGRASEARALLAIADDEDRHVDLAWRIVAWAAQTAPDEVLPALRDLRTTIADSAPERRALVLGAVAPCVDAIIASAAQA